MIESKIYMVAIFGLGYFKDEIKSSPNYKIVQHNIVFGFFRIIISKAIKLY